jgi:hypothetical protein
MQEKRAVNITKTLLPKRFHRGLLPNTTLIMANRLLNGDGDDGGDDTFVYTEGRAAPSDVRRAKIDESVDTVPASAFFNCQQLTEVEGHNKLKKIEEGAFQWCRRLRRLMKMGGVKEIEQYAFDGCYALIDLDFDKLEFIGKFAFNNCRALRSINLPSIKRVGDSAFHGCAITEAVFGEGLERIERRAFHNCLCLRRIVVPLKSNLIVEDDAFNCCDSLLRVDIIGGIHRTISSLYLESWRNEMKKEIGRINQNLRWIPSYEKTSAIQRRIRSVLDKMEHYKTEHKVLVKEATTLLELALWKANLESEYTGVPTQEGVRVTRRQVKRARKERCITSGAGVIIKNVLPFLELDE